VLTQGVKMSEKQPTAVAMTELQAHINPTLDVIVSKETELKNHLVSYVGTKLDQENVTVQMITEVLALEFPEFIYAMAEENYLLGYQQGLDDAEKLYRRTAEEAEE
jgi:uncharacterized protein (DUF2164 family)